MSKGLKFFHVLRQPLKKQFERCMLFKSSVPRNNRRYLVFLIFQIHLLIFFFVLVLWSRSQLEKGFPKTSESQILERKAQFLSPLEEDKTPEKLENSKR